MCLGSFQALPGDWSGSPRSGLPRPGFCLRRWVTLGVYWGYLGEATIELYWGCIGTMEKKMETAIMEKKMEATIM